MKCWSWRRTTPRGLDDCCLEYLPFNAECPRWRTLKRSYVIFLASGPTEPTTRESHAEWEVWIYKDTVLFRGHKITTTGIEPGPAKVNVIKEMPEPQNVADIRQVLGYGWLFSKAPSQSRLTPYTTGSAPLWHKWLLSGGVQQVYVFQKLKESSPKVLAQYSPAVETLAAADALSMGRFGQTTPQTDRRHQEAKLPTSPED